MARYVQLWADNGRLPRPARASEPWPSTETNLRLAGIGDAGKRVRVANELIDLGYARFEDVAASTLLGRHGPDPKPEMPRRQKWWKKARAGSPEKREPGAKRAEVDGTQQKESWWRRWGLVIVLGIVGVVVLLLGLFGAHRALTTASSQPSASVLAVTHGLLTTLSPEANR